MTTQGNDQKRSIPEYIINYMPVMMIWYCFTEFFLEQTASDRLNDVLQFIYSHGSLHCVSCLVTLGCLVSWEIYDWQLCHWQCPSDIGVSIRYWDGDQKTDNVADRQTIPNMANIVAEPVASSDATALVFIMEQQCFGFFRGGDIRGKIPPTNMGKMPPTQKWGKNNPPPKARTRKKSLNSAVKVYSQIEIHFKKSWPHQDHFEKSWPPLKDHLKKSWPPY